MKNIFERILLVVAIPVMILNLLGSVVGGIWLAVLGNWGLVGKGLLLLIGGAWMCSIPLLLTFPIAALSVMAAERGHKVFAGIAGTLSILLTNVVIGLWCLGIFGYFLSYETHRNTIPILLWTYAVAIGPWSYMASKEQGGDWSGIMVVFAQLGLIGAMVAYGIFGSSFETAAIVFGCFLVVNIILQAIVAFLTISEVIKMNNYYEMKVRRYQTSSVNEDEILDG